MVRVRDADAVAP